jgi:hypothetical protein
VSVLEMKEIGIVEPDNFIAYRRPPLLRVFHWNTVEDDFTASLEKQCNWDDISGIESERDPFPLLSE